ncbi:MAG: hypothetical protein L0Z53_17590 [Acidobacteriales bacterium]|nr:hypothetical protein [Terriglobales bacterium]
MRLLRTAPFRATILTVLLASSASLSAQPDPCIAIKAAKKSTYGFQPRNLSTKQQEAKNKQLDTFWNLANSHGAQGLECVAALLQAETSDTYFLFDAASLLAHFDRSGKRDQAVLDGLSRTDLRDLDMDGYIAVALQLSRHGADIGTIARKYLHEPKVTTYLARHGGYELNRVRGAILLYGSMQPALVDQLLAQEIASTGTEARETAAMVWSLNMTEASFKGLASLDLHSLSEGARKWIEPVRRYRAVTPTVPAKYTREQMLQKLARFPELGHDIDDEENRALDNSVYANFTAADFDAVREGRRKLIRSVSNESVDAYMEMSRVLLNLINKLDAYSQYRQH